MQHKNIEMKYSSYDGYALGSCVTDNDYGSCCFTREFIKCISFPIDGDSAVLSYLRFEHLEYYKEYKINIPFTRFPPTSVNKIRQMISKHHLPVRLSGWLSDLYIFWADENLLTSFTVIYILDITSGVVPSYSVTPDIYIIPIEYALARFEPDYSATYVWQVNKINNNKQKVIYRIQWYRDAHPIKFNLISSEVINILYSKLCNSSLIYTKEGFVKSNKDLFDIDDYFNHDMLISYDGCKNRQKEIMSLTHESYMLDYNNYFNCSINSDKSTAEMHIANTFDKMVFFINEQVNDIFTNPYAHCIVIFLNQLSVKYNDCDFITTKKRERYSFDEAGFLPFGVVVQHPYDGHTDDYGDIMIFGLKYKNGNPHLLNIHINHNEKSFLKQEDDQPILTLGDFYDKTSAMLFLFRSTPYNEISHKFTKANISQGFFPYPQCSPETKKIIEEDSMVYTWGEFRNLYNSCIVESIKLPNDSNPYSATLAKNTTKDILKKNYTASAFGENYTTKDILKKNYTASAFGENYTKAGTIVLAVLVPSFFVVAIILLFCLYGYKKGSYIANCFTASRSQNDENTLELEETVHSRKIDDTSIQHHSLLLNPEERIV